MVFFCTIGTTSVPSRKVYALNMYNGAFVWMRTIGEYYFCNSGSPVVSGGKVVLYGGDGTLYCLNEYNGATVWTHGCGNVIGAPSVSSGVVFVACDNWLLYAFYLSDGSTKWSYYAGEPLIGNTVHGGRVFSCLPNSYKVIALSESSGSLSWTYSGGVQFASSPAVANGKVYLTAVDGTEYVYALSEYSGSFQWSRSLGAYGGTTPMFGHSSPAVAADNRVFVGSWDKKVYALSESSGSILWSYSTGGFVVSSPAISDGAVFIGSWDKKVYCFKDAVIPIPPSLTLFDPQISDKTVTINGVVSPGTPGTTITRINWNWGDGTPVVDSWFPASHTYSSYGGYTVTATAYQSDGLTATQTKYVSLTAPQYTVTVNPNGGRVYVDGSPITSSTSYTWSKDSTHILDPDSGYQSSTGTKLIFNQWSDGNTADPRSMTVTGSATYTAEWTTQYQLTIGVSPSLAGTTNPATGTYWYNKGASVTVTVTPNTGYVFDHWELDSINVGTATSYTVTMNAPHGLVAAFSVAKPDFEVIHVYWKNEVDGMIVPYDEVSFEFAFRSNIKKDIHSVIVSYQSSTDVINAFAQPTSSVGDVQALGEFQTQNTIEIGGVDNSQIYNSIVVNDGKIYLSGSVKIEISYVQEGVAKKFSAQLTLTNDAGETLFIQYPNFSSLAGIDPSATDTEKEYYTKGDGGYSHIADYSVRKYAIIAGTYQLSSQYGSFPDTCTQVTYNAFEYVHDLLDPKHDHDGLCNDLMILQWVEDGLLDIDIPYAPAPYYSQGHICIEHAYLFTSFIRTLGLPARELDVALAEKKVGPIVIYSYQEAAAQVWYENDWHFFDLFIYLTNMDDYLNSYLAYRVWYAFSIQPIGHDFGLDPVFFTGTPVAIDQWKHLVDKQKNGLFINAHSPVAMLLVDPEGHRVGTTEDGFVVNEIPNAIYIPPNSEGYTNAADPSSIVMLDESIFISDPLPGFYLLRIFGTEEGTYSITIQSEALDGSIVDTETLTGTTSLGQLDTISVQLSEDGNLMTSPVASFTESAHTVPVGTSITFDPSDSYDLDGTIVLYEWDFDGDGVYDYSTTSPDPVSYTYMTSGTYSVTLRVTDNDGLIDTAMDTKIIYQKTVPEVPFDTVVFTSISMIIALVAYIAIPKLRRKRKYANP